MNIFTRALTRVQHLKAALTGVSSVDFPPYLGGGWLPLLRYGAGCGEEAFTGAWQRNISGHVDSVLSYPTVYACITLIASDVAKIRVKLVEQDEDGIWDEATSAAFSPVLRKPNHYQTRVQFYMWWVISKLVHGNTYILKQRDARNVVTALYILDPCRVRPMVAPDGSVFYQLSQDNLSGIDEFTPLMVPAREIIHDPMCPLFHPLCGISPLFAAALAALHGLRIMRNASQFFANGSRPGGVLLAPGNIHKDTADRLKTYWEENFSGDKVGSVAVLGDGLKYEPMSVVNAHDAEMIGQLHWTDEKICQVFHVPRYKVGVGPEPNYNSAQVLNQEYYAQCLQILYESIEILLDEGLELPGRTAERGQLGTEFDLDELLRMDTAALIESESKAIGAGIKSPDESRRRLGLGHVEGGDTPYLQQQNYSLSALARRDAAAPAPATPTAADPAPQSPPPEPDEDKALDTARALVRVKMNSTASRYAA